MTLSELVKLRQEVNELAHRELGRKDYQEFLWKVVRLEEDRANKEFSTYLESARDIARNRIEELNNELAMHFTQVLGNIDHYIAQESMQYQSCDYVASAFEGTRQHSALPMPQHVKDLLLSKIRLLSDWHYPGLEISPHTEVFTQYLVGSDPLYIADQSKEYLAKISSTFSEQYQTRLRKYLIEILPGHTILHDLPQQQFGLVVSWNFFNYLPMSVITKFLKEVYTLLRPGGTFLFGYNDASMYHGAKHVEYGGMHYTTKAEVTQTAEVIGYKVNDSHGEDSAWHNLSWMEIQKPGELSTVKAHQTLGIVKP